MIILTGELNLENGSSHIHVKANDDKIVVKAADWGSLSSCISVFKQQKTGKISQFYLKEIAQEIHIKVGDKKTAVLQQNKIKSVNILSLPRLAIAYLRG